MNESAYTRLVADVKAAEGLRLKAWLGHVAPPSAAQDMVDTLNANGELLGNVGHANAVLSHASDAANLFIRQFRHTHPSLSFGGLLESSRVGVQHLLSHCGEFKIAHVVVFSIAVKVIDRQASRDRPDEGSSNKTVNQESPFAFALFLKRYALLFCALMRRPFDRPGLVAPETSQPAYVAIFVDFVKSFVAINRFPHTVIIR